jgi:hypothetical protein
MRERSWVIESLVLGLLLALGLALAAWIGGDKLLAAKQLERTVTVKGLAEREVPADQAIWPIRYSVASNDLADLTAQLERGAALIMAFLKEEGFQPSEITVTAPSITDRQAQSYSDGNQTFRFVATHVVTVFTSRVEAVRTSRQGLTALSRQGLAITSDDYQARVEYLFTGLNQIKPAMIEEATQAGREVAQKFATDSQSELGKIRQANQGQFSIEDRDSNTPHIKRVRVVSTLEYYLVD